jgi:hypothetical protein
MVVKESAKRAKKKPLLAEFCSGLELRSSCGMLPVEHLLVLVYPPHQTQLSAGWRVMEQGKTSTYIAKG